ncbi:Astacin and ShK domain containing protein [Trichuris trichiura]|uniref:Metalloendopeptidase n=1 Tax=Trichuris trichiura TaxID=36087 RepID=A0A077Z126_TRITR|nr:Astacin and ShK domain containing protein [Trichuris trichiura]
MITFFPHFSWTANQGRSSCHAEPMQVLFSRLVLSAGQILALFEGDISGFHWDEVHPIADTHQLFAIFKHHTAVNLDTFPDKLWNHGRVPYVLDVTLVESERVALAQAFSEYGRKTCIHFVPKSRQDKDYILIKRNKRLGCSSFVGRAGGNQTVSLEVGKCFSKGIIAHELMHVLGFFHEHSRTDRDKFVRIIDHNIIPGMLKNFEKYSNNVLDTLRMPYDYGSVMHYHKLAFSRNGRATILPVKPKAVIGQRFQLSVVDTAKINKLYGCFRNATAATNSKPEVMKCADLHDHCKLWADLGHCKWSEKYMKSHCRFACGLCPQGKLATSEVKHLREHELSQDECKDRNLFCPYWAMIGECKNEQKFMKAYCSRSCNLCVLK